MKRELFEGGIRVPTIAWWPGSIIPATETGHISAFWDFLPTACDVAGIPLAVETDGISFLPTLIGKPQKTHEYLYWEFFEQGGRQGVRKDKWKAVKYNMTNDPNAPLQLFDLSRDISEDHDVSSQNPEITRKMANIMKTARKPSGVFQFEYEKSENP